MQPLQFSTEIKIKSATVTLTMFEKPSKDVIKLPHLNLAMKQQNSVAEKECPMEGMCQVNGVVY